MTIDRLNYLVQRSYWAIKRFVLVLYATVTRKRFFCRALCGESTYSICINSDMTVSCNYQDYDGSGHIGDLYSENLDTIFASSKAVQFRNSLASGRLPIITCAACSELVISTPEDARHRAKNWQVCSEGIMVENTVACPYRCKACPRNLLLQNRRSTHMTLDDVRKVSAIISEYEIKIMHFFNLGEPFSAHDVGDQLQIIRENNPNLHIAISTNGVLLNTTEKREAAMLANTIYFSIDGIDDYMMNKYQRGGAFSKAYGNMKKLVEYRRQNGKTTPIIEWKYVLFNWNDHERTIHKATELARSAGIDAISFCPTLSPFYGISWRYHLKAFYRTLGEPSWKGKEIRFDRLSSPTGSENSQGHHNGR